MKIKPVAILLLAMALVECGALRSQVQKTNSPVAASPFIFITRDVIKQGDFAEYERIQHEKAAVLKAANWPRVSIGLTHVTGVIKSEVFHYSFYKSFEDFGNDRKAIGSRPDLKKALRAIDDQENTVLLSREVIAVVYHPEISYQGDFNWASARYLSVIVNVLKPGHGFEYLEKSDIVKKAHTEAKLAENMAIYTDFSGGRLSTYFLMRPVTSLKGFDDLRAMLDSNNYKVGHLGHENQLKVHELFAASVEREEDHYFALDPAISYTTPEWAAGNLDFWKP